MSDLEKLTDAQLTDRRNGWERILERVSAGERIAISIGKGASRAEIELARDEEISQRARLASALEFEIGCIDAELAARRAAETAQVSARAPITTEAAAAAEQKEHV
ncbi:hypothetical protein [Oricola thermophila]|uniref:Uncharacterized protein n=1 Tax=Oricola thermophila TaxID=2742145 RepID=A0A6N1VDE7_9HYPH|nr:hypothetical protein [Oricola thermophila]QKV18748.1 hypothetical protein HTY61_09945 [Oricola thermophila]